jgi:hypothetical protein
VTAGKEGVVIRKMEAAGPNAKVRTPVFNNDANESPGQARDWARISVHYETDAEWIDELEFRYIHRIGQAVYKKSTDADSYYTLTTATSSGAYTIVMALQLDDVTGLHC